MHPESKAVVFKRDPAAEGSLPVFVKDDPEVIFNEMGTPEIGTQPTSTCYGDSGSPLWTTESVPGKTGTGICSKQNILVAINSGSKENKEQKASCTTGSMVNKIT